MKLNREVREILEFLSMLSNNNDRKWFNENKELYKSIHELFIDLADSFISRLSCFDSSVADLSVKDCTYRIYRDLRFSLDKTPYKTHMGVYVCPGGKKSGLSGYYLHLEPNGKSILAVGSYMPDKEALDNIREDVFSRSQEFLDSLAGVGEFVFDNSRKLKKLPMGFSSDSPMAEYLKQRDFCLIRSIPEKHLNGSVDNLLNFAIDNFRPLKCFNDFLNRAITYRM